jgi:hypothetical protein
LEEVASGRHTGTVTGVPDAASHPRRRQPRCPDSGTAYGVAGGHLIVDLMARSFLGMPCCATGGRRSGRRPSSQRRVVLVHEVASRVQCTLGIATQRVGSGSKRVRPLHNDLPVRVHARTALVRGGERRLRS